MLGRVGVRVLQTPAGRSALLDFTNEQSLTLRDLVLDGEHAASCLRLDASLGVVVTNVRSASTDAHGRGVDKSGSLLTQVLFTHYAYFGLLADALTGSSHELLISDCIFEEFSWGEAARLLVQYGTRIVCPATRLSQASFLSSGAGEPGYNDLSRLVGVALFNSAFHCSNPLSPP